MKRMLTWIALSVLFLVGTAWAFDNYHFDSLVLKTEVWINKKTVFKKPTNINVEFVTAGEFDWVIADKDGKEIKTVRAKNAHGGWTGLNLHSLGLYGDYSIGFRNASSNEQQIKQGDVELE